MADEIINRVAQSKLVTFDLETYYPEGKRVQLDIKDWLYEGLILREKEFRAAVNGHSWENYQNTYVAISCSSDAIVPGWAYMLVTTKLQPFAKKIVQGTLEQLETVLYQEVIDSLEVSEFEGKPVIIKGCSKKPVPPNAYLWITAKLQPIVKSLMYGEACSSVPLFKNK
ncbi:DUF2480 family protein [Flavobacteriaceae bacterium TP-CH-4]|uniref:DUF2480 family protein n=1 Tax=Pelagihabitans pacificus TaxID=2696054 RepID=A0A967E7K1_9FLAO|nr:DUF2480 family protein [Pelagihabitans pacificus]NHF60334.1 DUF2480 family protein [Pelagihabitans pacificus]